MAKALFGISGFVKVILGLIGLLIHIWSIYICYMMYGFIGGIVSFLLPFVSQVYLVVMSTIWSGTFFTMYNVVVIVYGISAIIVSIVFAAAANSVDNSN